MVDNQKKKPIKQTVPVILDSDNSISLYIYFEANSQMDSLHQLLLVALLKKRGNDDRPIIVPIPSDFIIEQIFPGIGTILLSSLISYDENSVGFLSSS